MDAYHEERGQEKDPLLDIDRPSINKGNTPSPPPYEHEPSHVTVKGYVQWFSSLPRDQKLRTISFFVLPVEIGVFLFMFGVYFQMQVYQQYYYQRIFRSIIANWTNVSDLNFSIYDICLSQDQIVNLTSPDTFVTGQKHINIYSMLTTIAFLLPSIMISPLIGTLSDQVGRKPAMLLVFGGQILSGILGVCIVYFDLHMLCFLATSFITGISGGFGMMMSSSFAYVTDITPKKFLTVRMAAVEASIFVGTGISSAISDMWIEKTHCTFKAQVWLILAVQICGFIFSLLIRESLSKENMVESFTKIKWGFHRIAKGFKLFFWPSYIGINLWKVWVVVIVIVLAMINETGSSEITGYFLYNKPLQWSIGEVGRYLLVSSFSHLLALLFLLPLLVLLKFSDPLISMIGVIVSCVMNVYIALLTTTWEMFSGIDCITVIFLK